MLKPVYIICAQSTAEDRQSNMLSIFNVTEKLTVDRNKHSDHDGQDLPIVVAMRLRAVAVWKKNRTETSVVEYEGQFVLHPPSGDPMEVGIPKAFTVANGKHLKRLILDVQGVPVGDKPGDLLIESRVRPVGSNEWQSQFYPIVIEIVDESEERGQNQSREAQE